MIKQVIKSIFVIALFFSSVQLNAQKEIDLTISMGSVHPISSFTEQGYAQSGFNLQITANYPLFDLFSLSGKFMFANAGLDHVKYQGHLNSTYPDFMSDVVRYDINNWLWAAPMIGLKYRYPIVIQKFYITAAAYSGMSYHQTPDLNSTAINEETNRNFIIETTSDYNLSIPVYGEIGALFKANNNISFSVAIGYFNSSTQYDQNAYTINSTSGIIDEIVSESEITIPIKALQTSFGLVYKL